MQTHPPHPILLTCAVWPKRARRLKPKLKTTLPLVGPAYISYLVRNRGSTLPEWWVRNSQVGNLSGIPTWAIGKYYCIKKELSGKERNIRFEPSSKTDAQRLSRVKDWVKWNKTNSSWRNLGQPSRAWDSRKIHRIRRTLSLGRDDKRKTEKDC
jgi:hypothetical protein